MFINLKEAGQTDVMNGSGIGVQSGGASVISGIQFGDPSDPHSGEYISQNVNDIYLILTSQSKLYWILYHRWYSQLDRTC